MYSPIHNVYTTSVRHFISLSGYAWVGIDFWKQQRWVTEGFAPGYLDSACFGVCIKICEQWWKEVIPCHHPLFCSASCRMWKKKGGITFWLANICFSLIVKILSVCFTLFPCSIWKQKKKRRRWAQFVFLWMREGKENFHSEKEVMFSFKYASRLSTSIFVMTVQGLLVLSCYSMVSRF